MMRTVRTPSRQHPASAAPASGTPSPGRAGPTPPQSPPAHRPTRPTWRDPRLLVGIALVAGSVLVGAQLLARADDTVSVWTARGDLTAGAPLEVGDLERSELRFGSDAVARRYLPGTEAPPPGLVLVHDVAAGELVPRSAVGPRAAEELAQLPIALASDAVPAGLRVGERVDVWVTRPAGPGQEPGAVRVLQQVQVVAAPSSTSSLGPSATRQVVVGVPQDDAVLARALAQLADGAAVLVRRG